jgi:adenylate cyclase
MITGAWIIIGILMTIYDYLVLSTSTSMGPSIEYSFRLALVSNVGSALIGAALGGSFLVFFVNVRYQDKPYGYTVLAVTLAFMIVISLIIIVIGATSVVIRTGKPISHPDFINGFEKFMMDSSRIKNIMTWSVVVACTQLVLQINNKFGQGVLGRSSKGNITHHRKSTGYSCSSI